MSGDRRTIGWILAIAVVASVYALTLLFTGGFEAELFGTRIRSRAWERPAVIACVLYVLAVTVALRKARGRAATLWTTIDSPTTAWWLTAAAVTWALLAGWHFGTFAAGGADSFGYVSQARLFTTGALVDDVPIRPEFTWRDASASLIPLGYRPAPQPNQMAPVYPPGLPLLMALLMPFGDRAAYAVVPLLGGVLLIAVTAIGRQMGSALAGAIAALWLSVSATFLLMQFSPMSDVPVTAMWLLSLACGSATFTRAPAISGLLAAAAVLIRPNLMPLALVVVVIVVASPERRGSAFAAFTAPLVAAIAALMWIQWRRYGAPLISGYGDAGDLFALAYIAPNAASYAARVTAVYTPLVWLCLASPLVSVRSRVLFGATWVFLILVWLSYVAYEPFEAWFFTRFLLPAIPLMLVLAAMVMLAAIRRLPVWSRPAAVLTLVVVMSLALMRESQRRGVFESQAAEQRYPAAGYYVRDRLAPNTYVLARQHSGSVRLYSGRPTIRWDVIGGDQLDFVVRTVRATGSSIYLVVDDDEMPAFEKHFEGQATVAQLRTIAQFGQARVYAVE